MSGSIAEIPAAPVALPVFVIGLVLGLVWLRRRDLLSAGRVVTMVGLNVYLVAVLCLTLLPLQVETGMYANQASWFSKINIIPILTIDVRTFGLNVLMTVPLGVFVSMLSSRPTVRRAVVTTLLVSLGIETVQSLTNIFLSSGRTGDVNDLLANALGGALGALLHARLRRSPHLARLLGALSVPPDGSTTRPDEQALQPRSVRQ